MDFNSDMFGIGNVLQLDLMIDVLGASACGMEDFTGAADQAKRYLRRKLSSLDRPAAPGSKPLLSSLLPPDHSIRHLLTRMLVFSPVSYFINIIVHA